MSDQPTEIEQKMIEFATKTAQTIQNQARQIRALSHVLLIALTAVSEKNETFKNDLLPGSGWYAINSRSGRLISAPKSILRSWCVF